MHDYTDYRIDKAGKSQIMLTMAALGHSDKYKQEKKTTEGGKMSYLRIKNKNIKRYIEHLLFVYPTVIRNKANDITLSAQRRARLTAISTTIEQLYDRADDDTKKLIKLKYWGGNTNITGAALKTYMSEDGAYRRINHFLYLVAVELGEI